MSLRILAYSPFMPYPPDHGGRIRTFLLLRELARLGHSVHVVPLVESADEERWVVPMRTEGIEVHPVLHPRRFGSLTVADKRRKFGKLLGGHSDVLARFDSPLAPAVAAEKAIGDWDVVLAELLWTAPLALRTPGRVHVLDAHNVEYVIARRTAAETTGAKKLPALLEARGLRNDERRLARAFDAIVAVSEHDKAQLAALAPSVPIDVVGNCVDTDRLQPGPLPETDGPVCLFMGSTNYPPNRDAILRFARRILPRLRTTSPAARFLVVGANPAPEVRALDGTDGIEILGYVDELADVYARSTIVVVPLDVGGGTRTKILEAMAFGRPVVSTTIGCEGLGVTAGEDLIVVDDDDRFADEVDALHRDRDRAHRIADRARRFVEAHGSARRAGVLFDRAIRQAAGEAVADD